MTTDEAVRAGLEIAAEQLRLRRAAETERDALRAELEESRAMVLEAMRKAVAERERADAYYAEVGELRAENARLRSECQGLAERLGGPTRVCSTELLGGPLPGDVPCWCRRCQQRPLSGEPNA